MHVIGYTTEDIMMHTLRHRSEGVKKKWSESGYLVETDLHLETIGCSYSRSYSSFCLSISLLY